MRGLTARQRWGALLTIVGIGLTVALAFLGNTTKPPPASTQALIAFLAIAAQVGAAWVFSGDGKADPTLAQRSVARMINLAQRASAARKVAERAQKSGVTLAEMRGVVGQLSVHLSYLEEGYVEAIDDWRTFHSRAVDQAEEGAITDDE